MKLFSNLLLGVDRSNDFILQIAHDSSFLQLNIRKKLSSEDSSSSVLQKVDEIRCSSLCSHILLELDYLREKDRLDMNDRMLSVP